MILEKILKVFFSIYKIMGVIKNYVTMTPRVQYNQPKVYMQPFPLPENILLQI